MSMPSTEHSEAQRRELILYATPEGALLESCEAYFDELRSTGRATTAQTYPPHVTLTGFFRRRAQSVDRVANEARAAIESTRPGTVHVSDVAERDGWVGLEIDSRWFSTVAATFADHHELEPGDDTVRLKDWLHLSLAYGDRPPGTELAVCAALARDMIVGVSSSWSIGLWERSDAGWMRHC